MTQIYIKQRMLLISACLLIIIGTTLLYRHINPGKIIFRTAESHFFAERYEVAVSYYAQSLKFGTHTPDLFYHMAEAQLKTGDFEGVEQTISAFEKTPIATSENSRLLAEIFVTSGRFNEASRLLLRSLTLNPKNRKARFRLAQTLTWTGNFDSAIEHYNTLLEDKK